MPQAPLDTRYVMESPEGINLVMHPAGPVSRALAYGLDLCFRLAIVIVLSVALFFFDKLGTGLFLICFFIITWWYMVLFEVLGQGQSPGKKILGLRVVHDDGTPIGWSASLIRNLLRTVDMLPLGYAAGLFSCLYHPAFKRLGDLAAGTLVIYEDSPAKRPHLPEITPATSTFALSRAEQQSIIGFAERRQQLSPERRVELAQLLVDGESSRAEAMETRLYQVAKGLVGS